MNKKPYYRGYPQYERDRFLLIGCAAMIAFIPFIPVVIGILIRFSAGG